MSTNRYDFTVATLFRIPPVAGEIGLEIEVEGTNLPGYHRNEEGNVAVPMRNHWRIENDGSLRTNNPGDEACEYVLRNPVSRDDLSKALDFFTKKWSDAGATSYDTYRCSVHVHLNVSDWPMRRVYSFLTAWFILEELLVDWADGGTNHRVGNRFCLRAKDAEGIIDRLQQMAKEDFRGRPDRNTLKYGAVNIAALAQYGSLEFRALRGTTDTKLIRTWVDMLLRIKDFAAKYDNPNEIIQDFSGRDPIAWAREVLGDLAESAFQGDLTKATEKLFGGMRLAQDVGYATNWQPYKRPGKEEASETAPEAPFHGQAFVGLIPTANPPVRRVRETDAPVRAEPTVAAIPVVTGAIRYGRPI
jgi:hypothetical protein